MKPYFLLIILAVLIACTPFPTRFDRIEPNALRALNAVFLPSSDAAPGDTVTMRLYFAGDSVSNVSDWEISTDIITNDYGSDTAVNFHSIPSVNTQNSLPESISVSFVVPDSIFYTTQAVSEAKINFIRPILPAGMRSFTRNQLADFMTDLSKTNFSDTLQLVMFAIKWATPLGLTGIPTMESLAPLIPATLALTNLFSIKSYITCTAHTADGKSLPIQSQFVIRYNSALQNSPVGAYVPVNHNPVINWISIIDVAQANVNFFDPSDPAMAGKITTHLLYHTYLPDSISDTILIDDGHSYFFAVDSGISPIKVSDTGLLVDNHPVMDAATLRISLPAGKVNIPVIPGDTISDPFIASRILNGFFYRPQHIAPFIAMAGDTLFAGRGTSAVISTGDTAGLTIADRKNISMELISRDFGITLEQTVAMEEYNYTWWFQNIDKDKTTLPEDSLILPLMSNGNLASFLPPVDTAMHRFRIWVAVMDNFLGELNRPYCETTRSGAGYFKYTQAYINKH
jgi:hypothetical protein